MDLYDLPRQPGVYRILHIASGRMYVGSSVDVRRRYIEHFTALETGTHWNRHLQFAFKRYGRDAFVFEVVEFFPSWQEARSREQALLDWLFAQPRTRRFNLSTSATGIAGITISARQRRSMSRAHKGKKQTPEHVAKRAASNRERPRTEKELAMFARQRGRKYGPKPLTTRMLISSAKKGKPLSTVQEAMYESRRGQPIPWLDGQRGKETPKARRYWDSLKGQPPDASHAAANSRRRGTTLPDDHKANIATGMRKYFDEHPDRPKRRTTEKSRAAAAARRGRPWSEARRAAHVPRTRANASPKQLAYYDSLIGKQNEGLQHGAEINRHGWSLARRTSYEASKTAKTTQVKQTPDQPPLLD